MLQAEPAAPADPEDDIFGDAGKAYEPALAPTPRDGAAAAAAPADRAPQGAGPANGAGGRARGAYFDTVDDMRDLPALPKPGARARQASDMGAICGFGAMCATCGTAAAAPARRRCEAGRPHEHCNCHPALQL